MCAIIRRNRTGIGGCHAGDFEMTTLAPASARRRTSAAHANGKRKGKDERPSLKQRLKREFYVWLAGVLFGVLLASGALGNMLNAAGSWIATVRPVLGAPVSAGMIAPFFSPEVRYWERDIARWAGAHNLDPNLLATVMQIESCGHPSIGSSAGAQGLFQVMPFHFSTGENMHDPDTNARRGADFLAYCLDYANDDVGLALACYNGGPSVVGRAFDTWARETQRYYVWGTTIYNDAKQNVSSSPSLQAWLDAGGAGLCQRANTELAERS
jgi:soluble lytic murein transglycosylase-like protein